MKITIQLVLLLLILSKKTIAQNLVINGDFEQCIDCPEDPGQLEYCPGWYIPNRSTPDLFKGCHHIKSFFNVPLNAFGFQHPKSGVAYIGLVVIDGTYDSHREYIQVKLTEILTEGKNYKISFYISWADYSNYFCDRMGYLFTEAYIEPQIGEALSKKKQRKKNVLRQVSINNFLPQSNGYVPLNFEIIKDREQWHKIEFTYQARGNEKYLTLGLFGDNATQEDYHRYIGKVFGKFSKAHAAAYFYLDDISIVQIDFTHKH